MHWSELSSADGFAMSMILILTLGLGTAFMVILTVVKHSRRTDSAEDLLIEEAHREAHGYDQAPEPPPAEAAALQPWEREADWWQREK
ncbi:MAG: hypothetical protein JWO82_4198 [Akkermansiaceae bacterium]|nr:hypothetical protein [Akkermansiaceae bacterium]